MVLILYAVEHITEKDVTTCSPYHLGLSHSKRERHLAILVLEPKEMELQAGSQADFDVAGGLYFNQLGTLCSRIDKVFPISLVLQLNGAC